MQEQTQGHPSPPVQVAHKRMKRRASGDRGMSGAINAVGIGSRRPPHLLAIVCVHGVFEPCCRPQPLGPHGGGEDLLCPASSRHMPAGAVFADRPSAEPGCAAAVIEFYRETRLRRGVGGREDPTLKVLRAHPLNPVASRVAVPWTTNP